MQSELLYFLIILLFCLFGSLGLPITQNQMRGVRFERTNSYENGS